VSEISGERGICKALKRVRMGKARGDGVGFKRGWCCLGVRECFELGAGLAELLGFGFVVMGDRISKGEGGICGVTGGRDRETECGLVVGLGLGLG
jgi:hypothetical protein